MPPEATVVSPVEQEEDGNQGGSLVAGEGRGRRRRVLPGRPRLEQDQCEHTEEAETRLHQRLERHGVKLRGGREEHRDQQGAGAEKPRSQPEEQDQHADGKGHVEHQGGVELGVRLRHRPGETGHQQGKDRGALEAPGQLAAAQGLRHPLEGVVVVVGKDEGVVLDRPVDDGAQTQKSEEQPVPAELHTLRQGKSG